MLAAFPTGGPNSERYVLSLDTCGAETCPFRLSLKRDNRVVDSTTLGWPAGTGGFTLGSVGTTFGAADPLDEQVVGKAWLAEDVDVATTAATVQIAPNRYALLVHQTGGFDHVKRRHDIFTVNGDTLDLIWSAKEAAGPVWSAVISTWSFGAKSAA